MKEYSSVIQSLENLLSELDAESDQVNIQDEVFEFGRKQRDEIWKKFLRKNMESLKMAITNNMKLN